MYLILLYLILIAVVITAIGYSLLCLMPEGARRDLSYAAPGLGAAALVIGLSWTGLVLPVGVASLPLVAVMIAGPLLWARRRGPFNRPSLLRCLLGLAVGLVPVVLALAPLWPVGEPATVLPGPNHDAYAYVSVSDWLQEHPILDRPGHDDPPAYDYASFHLRTGLRIGQELAQATMATLLRQPPVETFYIVMAAWLFVLPGVGAATFALARAPAWLGLVAGLAVGINTSVINQVFNQNSDAVLGLCLMPLAVMLVSRYCSNRDSGIPWWTVCLMVTAVIGTYTEYFPILAVALACYFLIAGWRRWGLVGGRILRVVLGSAVMSPFIWFSAIYSLSTTSGLTFSQNVSPFLERPLTTIAARAFGLIPLEAEIPELGRLRTLVVFALLATIGVGLLVALTNRRSRSLAISTCIGVAVTVAYLSTVHRFDYGQQRAVQIALPVFIFAATAGLAELGALIRRRFVGHMSFRVLEACAVGLLIVTYSAVTVRSARLDLYSDQASHRVVDEGEMPAVKWAREARERDKTFGMTDSNFFQHIWAVFALRDETDVVYPMLYPDYGDKTGVVETPRHIPDLLSVSTSDYVDCGDQGVIERKAAFMLLDMKSSDCVVATTGPGFYGPEQAGPAPGRWMQGDGTIVFVTAAGAPTRVRISAIASPELGPLPVDVIAEDGRVTVSRSFSDVPTELILDLAPGSVTRLTFHSSRGATRSRAVPDGRPVSIRLLEVKGE